MRERQRLKKEAEKAGAVARRASSPAGRQGRKVSDPERGAVAVPAVSETVGFTWGKPLPRRTKTELRQVWRKHRREKAPPRNPPKAGCRCGECSECARRKRHTEHVRKRRAEKANG